MHRTIGISALALSATLPAQLDIPSAANPTTSECNARNNYVFQRQNSRGQCFYDVSEMGNLSNFVILSNAQVRWDGATAPGGLAGPFTMNVTVKVGTTNLGIGQVNAAINASVTNPLTTLFSGNINYLPQAPIGPVPQPWGAQSGQFTFPTTTPIAVSIPTGGCFVFELQGTSGTISGTNALLDFQQDAAALVAGPATATSFGTGCPATSGGANAAYNPLGQFAPGTAFSASASGLGANNLVLLWAGSNTLAFGSVPLPFGVPGTTCSLLVDPSLLLLVTTANAAGSITAYQAGSFFVIPKSSALNGILVHTQMWSIGAPHAGNPLGIFFTNGRAIQFGSYNGSTLTQTWFNGYHLNATNAEASFSGQGGYAVRLN